MPKGTELREIGFLSSQLEDESSWPPVAVLQRRLGHGDEMAIV